MESVLVTETKGKALATTRSIVMGLVWQKVMNMK